MQWLKRKQYAISCIWQRKTKVIKFKLGTDLKSGGSAPNKISMHLHMQKNVPIPKSCKLVVESGFTDSLILFYLTGAKTL